MVQADQVVIYGASGYVGKLIFEAFISRGLAFTVAGRDKASLQLALAEVSGRAAVKKVDVEIAQAEHAEPDLITLFAHAKVVINAAGPASEVGDVVVRSALAAGCHYLDVACEQDFILAIKEKYSLSFANKGLLLAPACSTMWTLGCLAAEVTLENDDVDSLEIAYLNDVSFPSLASAQSLVHLLSTPHCYLKNNQLLAWDLARTFDVVIPGRAQVFNASSWGGGAEPIWYQGDRRVRNCKVYQCVDDNNVMRKLINIIGKIIKSGDDISKKNWLEEVKAAAQITPLGDEENNQQRLSGIVHCTGYGSVENSSCTINFNSPHLITSELIAECAHTLLEGAPNAVGLSSPAAAFGHRELLKMLADQGLLVVNEA